MSSIKAQSNCKLEARIQILAL